MALNRIHALHTAALAHRAWFALRALHSGGTVFREDGIWCALPASDEMTATLAFPLLHPGLGAEALRTTLGRIRAQGTVGGVLCWTLRPEHRTELGVLLVARGFEVGWQAHWMARDLRAAYTTRPQPAGLEIAQVEEVRDWSQRGRADLDVPEWLRSREANQDLIAVRPQQVWAFRAFLNGDVVAGTTLFVPPGFPSVALLHDVVVAPEQRRCGIGAAITEAACSHARGLGCRVAVLNATRDGELLYPHVGFCSLSRGQTWWMHRPALVTPASPEQVRFAEALARGDLVVLESLHNAPDLDAPLPSGSTPLQVAATFGQPAVAGWLLDRGAHFDILAGWELGWRERVADELRRSPESASARDVRSGMTLLHEAVIRNDLALLRTVLAAGGDPTVQDSTHHATPLGWARFLGRADLVRLLEHAEPSPD
ncbi:MAG: GNAT family N-acetyltransferase [Chloroflexota bacterium]|nr:GNAT family N-acetyltransferase [Chloroflexota bacterium]